MLNWCICLMSMITKSKDVACSKAKCDGQKIPTSDGQLETEIKALSKYIIV